MLDLIGNLWGFMLLALLLSGVAGWLIADMRAKPRWRILEDERRYLRAEILGLAGERAPVSEQAGARRRIADLEQALAESRGRGVEVEVLRLRIAELERANAASPKAVGAIDVTDYTAKIASLEADLAQARSGMPAPVSLEVDRNRIFALEQELEEAEAKAAAAEALEARVKQLEAAPPAVPADEITMMQWRNRYLGERVKYLEAHVPAEEAAPAPAPAPPPDDTEQDDRVRWRMRYFEQRAVYLDGERATLAAELAKPLPPPVEDAAPFKARIAELETALSAASVHETRAADLATQFAAAQAGQATNAERARALEAKLADIEKAGAARAADLQGKLADAEKRAQANADLEHDAIRARWKGRYLEARVRYLEGRALTPPPAPVVAPQPAAVAPPQPAPAPQPVAPKPAPKPAPATTEIFRLERPMALSSPRNGAPDDLRLIGGVTGQAQSSLNAIGVFHFDQIAGWTAAHVAWVDQYLNLRGRIAAERWVEQAGRLARGESAVLDEAL